MKKIIIVSVFLIILIGCGRSDYEPIYDPYTGTRGLEINFLDNAPPRDIYEQESFPVGINLKNRGAFSIESGTVNLNFERDYINVDTSDDTSIFLNGRTYYNPEGEQQNKLFYLRTSKMDSMSQVRNSLISVKACYEYGTQLKTQTCIDPDVFNLLSDRSKPCSVQEERYSGQGAPVAIRRIVPTISTTPDNENIIIPEFDITIQNVGRGNVVSRGSIYRHCSNEQISRDDFNKVEIIGYVGNRQLDCNPPIVNLENDVGNARCRLNEGFEETSTAYETLLEIHLRYGYTTSISKEFRIHRK